MLEMLMLLGTGLFAAGVAGMTGIASQQDEKAPEIVRTEDDLSEFEMGDTFGSGESEDILTEVRRIGDALDMAEFAEDAEATGDSDASADDADLDAQSGIGGSEAPQEDIAANLAIDDVIAAVEDAVSGLPTGEDSSTTPDAGPVTDDEAVTLADTAEAPDEAPSDASDVPPTGTDQTEARAVEDDGEDGPEVISDFLFGQEKLSLMLPEDMGADTQLRIEPAGDGGGDAAVVLEDSQGSLTAAVIRGGFGSVTPDDIEFEYAA